MLSIRRACTALACLLIATAATGATRPRATVADFTSSAALVFRGTCEKVEPGTVEVAGARLAVTIYTFRVTERLKGHAGGTITFRQIGSPSGGASDLGRLAGLPSYLPGQDYLLFLLPESRAGLTSPAGAAQGAFAIAGDRAVPLRAIPGDPSGLSLETVRRQVLEGAGR
jgi:hypothetical protein